MCVDSCLPTLERLEALQGNSGGAGDELQQAGSALLVEGLHGFPEPFDDVALCRAVLEARVGLPVVDVDFTQATYDQLRVEDRSRAQTVTRSRTRCTVIAI